MTRSKCASLPAPRALARLSDRYYTGTPLWPFGYGQSFSRWSLHGTEDFAHTATAATDRVDELSWSVVVTNTGAVAGQRTVMAFAGAAGARGSLWGLQKVALAPGESATLRFADSVDWCPLCTVDGRGVRAVRPGTYTVRFGGDGGGLERQEPQTTVVATVHLSGGTVLRSL